MLAHRSFSQKSDRGLNPSSMHHFLVIATLLILLVGLAGCGNKDEQENQDGQVIIPEGPVLATVDGKEITTRDYKESLKKLQPSQLPLDGNGQILDMSSDAGKLAFLNTLIDKEALVAGGKKVGYEKDEMVKGAKVKYLEGAANEMMSIDVIQNNTSQISEEDFQAFVARFGMNRECLFLITNYEEQAIEARERSMQGEDWDTIVADLHVGIMPPKGLTPLNVIYGNEKFFFDEAVFAVGIGEVTEPIQTGSGYWVLKVMKESPAPTFDIEANKPTILGILQYRMKEQLHRKFREEVRGLHKLKINEEALVIAFNGLDPLEMGRDPQTGKAKPVDELKPLAISSKDLDMVFYSYIINGRNVSFTLGEYKEHFDRMNGMKRPVFIEMIGGMRTKITQELEIQIINDEARVRGYFENPEVLRMVDNLVDEMIVGQLIFQTVSFDKNVGHEVIKEYYELNKDSLFIPETRDGLVVLCRSETLALQAIALAQTNQNWDLISKKFGTDPVNQSTGGQVTLWITDKRPSAQALFKLQEKSQMSQPFPVGDGRFGVVVLLETHKAHAALLEEVNFEIAATIRREREAEARNALVESMRKDVVIEIFETELAALPSYEEAIAVEAPQNVVSGS
jgi:hypothetical protein